MTRKRYIKLLMAAGWSRNEAEDTVGFDEVRFCQPWSERRTKYALSHRGNWPYSTYERAYDNETAWKRMRQHSMLVEPPISLLEEM